MSLSLHTHTHTLSLSLSLSFSLSLFLFLSLSAHPPPFRVLFEDSLKTLHAQFIFECEDYIHAHELTEGSALVDDPATNTIRLSVGGDWELVKTTARSWVWQDRVYDSFQVMRLPRVGTTGRAARPYHYYAREDFKVTRPIGTPFVHTHWLSSEVSMIPLFVSARRDECAADDHHYNARR